eukprot:CAMPEP_0198219894 /NCGR_PEP_ID=MMETSP1445-20131203/76635_1 /TAXON_ID=36898 /ORGANISM="Pyramimonas sp., Strain CCMP2087" /LENGTH=76 /DNA_ID=CAMNT_0043897465 /DNA_START=363 /DNA_END=593 /DNA_ORIENTATION=+
MIIILSISCRYLVLILAAKVYAKNEPSRVEAGEDCERQRDANHSNRVKEKLRVLQERQSVVTKKLCVVVVAQGEGI